MKRKTLFLERVAMLTISTTVRNFKRRECMIMELDSICPILDVGEQWIRWRRLIRHYLPITILPIILLFILIPMGCGLLSWMAGKSTDIPVWKCGIWLMMNG